MTILSKRGMVFLAGCELSLHLFLGGKLFEE